MEATAFRNFGITKFFFPSEILFNRAKPFSCSQLRTTKLISSHLNSSIVIGAILDSAHVFKRKIQIPDPKQIPHLPLEKKVKFPPSSNTEQANSPGMPGGGGCQGFDLIRALLWQEHAWVPAASETSKECRAIYSFPNLWLHVH